MWTFDSWYDSCNRHGSWYDSCNRHARCTSMAAVIDMIVVINMKVVSVNYSCEKW